MRIKTYKNSKGEVKYRFRAYLGKNPITNKIKSAHRTGFDSYEEAKKEYESIRRQNIQSLSKDLTFREVYEDWFKLYKTTVKKSTSYTTSLLFKNHILPYFKDVSLRKLEYHVIQELIINKSKELVNYRELSSYISKVFRHGIRLGVVKTDLTQLIYYPKKEVKKDSSYNFYDIPESKKFLKCCKKDLNLMWYTFFHLLVYTGIRKGEGLALRWSDIDLRNKTLTINKTLTRSKNGSFVGSPKSPSSNRTIFLDDSTIKALDLWKSEQTKIFGLELKVVFNNLSGGYLTSSFPLKQMDYVIDNNNLRKITLHGLRHTHASMLFDAGMDLKLIQKRLGHSKYETTVNVYTHIYKEKEENMMNEFMKVLDL